MRMKFSSSRASQVLFQSLACPTEGYGLFEQRLEMVRFGNEPARAAFQGFGHRSFGGIAVGDDDPCLGVAGHQVCQTIGAAHAGHVEVENDQLDFRSPAIV